MEIMLSHLGISMTYDALDGLDIHAQRLHLRHIGVAAAVRREQADIVPRCRSPPSPFRFTRPPKPKWRYHYEENQLAGSVPVLS